MCAFALSGDFAELQQYSNSNSNDHGITYCCGGGRVQIPQLSQGCWGSNPTTEICGSQAVNTDQPPGMAKRSLFLGGGHAH